MTDSELEDIRDSFAKMSNVDLFNLNATEVRDMLRLLPATMVFLHERYDMAYVYGADEED